MTRRCLLLGAAAAAVNGDPVRWISLNVQSREQRERWPAASSLVSMGSLLKPFLAAAYGTTHAEFPTIRCAGTRTRCWFASGHGEQTLVEALANSCNTYFLALASALDRSALETTCLSYDLSLPDRSLSAANLIGFAGGWPQSPSTVVQAFGRLALNASEGRVRLILAGMARSAQLGTARAIGIPCYAKTGTAPCSHSRQGAGDGFVAAMFPLDRPRHVLLVEHHNTTGASAARDVKPLISSIV